MVGGREPRRVHTRFRLNESSSCCFPESAQVFPATPPAKVETKPPTATSAAAPWPARVAVGQSDAEVAALVEEELSDDETSSGASKSTVGSGKHRRHMDGAGGRSFSRKNWRTPYGQPHRACHSARSVVVSSAAGLWSSLVRQFMTYCVDWSVGAMAFSAEIGAGMNSMAGSSAEKSTAGHTRRRHGLHRCILFPRGGVA